MSLDYVEIRLTIPADAVEAVANLLIEEGSGGVVIDDESEAVLRAYFPADDRVDGRLQQLRTRLSDLVAIFPGMAEWREERSQVREEDWSNAWRDYYHPTRIGRHLVVTPTWEEPTLAAGDVVIRLDPGMAFGTGTHASTTLVMRRLEDLAAARDPRLVRGPVLDVGTGSGILAITAAKLGGEGPITAIDVDPVAVRTARINVAENGLDERVRVKLGEVRAEPEGSVQLLLSNIVAEVLEEIAGEVRRLLRPDGLWIASGLLDHYAADFAGKMQQQGFSDAAIASEAGWSAVTLRRLP